MEIVELLVRMDCNGCERKVRKQLSKLKGVDDIEIDLLMNKVTVIGYVDRRKVLKAVRKTGKRAEFWPHGYRSNPYGNSYYNHSSSNGSTYSSRPYNYTASNYMLQHQAFRNTYNYEMHGYNNYEFLEHEDGYYDSTSNDTQASIFSDENPNACSIM